MRFKQLWEPPTNPSKTYLILDNIFSAITHGVGFGLSVAGLVILIVRAVQTGGALKIVSFTLYGSSLVLLYLFSTLYHSLVFTRARRVFQIFDHSSIFILIAGSYTPYTLVAIGGAKGWTMWGIIIGLATLGILFYIFNQGKFIILDTILYVLMGWMVIFASADLYPILGRAGFTLLFMGGVAYTVGAVLFTMRRIPFIHVIWHLFVMLGSILMYFSILLYI
ncbi:hemolysin III family protein [Lactobacillus sp. PV037]|uniref:PAQR family membrane homeostasis protein TrhA n=1 Tax=unclassified Lactobacillus TaxID=2620435 RepID=UPI00223F035B|nr:MULTISPECIES: hemolysin III family protein [unclassified Lactobacillus]QNQ82356.1 hemolysin III family protein [Lactobacillus sp. PV012]QNQ83530.1 hemolysin III family protein [Lactobacillus sp. PV037]